MSERLIKNFDELATTTNKKIALQIMEAGLDGINTEKVVESAVSVFGDILSIKGKEFDLSKYNKIKVVGFGKSSCDAASALEKILGSRIRTGAVIGLNKTTCDYIETFAGTHPRPSPQNTEASKKIFDIVKNSAEDDLIIALVSGGGSALLCSSEEECVQGAKLYDAFLKADKTITEINTVRKHLSSLKGGGLAKIAYPATVIGLIFSDIPGDNFEDVASGPTYKDRTTIEDARKIIIENNLGEFNLTETPKEDKYFEKVYNFVLVSNKIAVEAMSNKAKEFGIKTKTLSTELYDDADIVAKEIFSAEEDDTAILAAGEPRVVVKGKGGKGGRNLHLGLCAIAEESVNPGSVFISFASDGMDNSDAAGAVVDTGVIERAKKIGLDAKDYLERLDSYTFFEKAGGMIKTGPTGSNVSDLMILLNKKEENKISKIVAGEIKDSRGNSTLQITVWVGEISGSFSVPSGASTGFHEAHELRDSDGKGVTNALNKINNIIIPALLGQNVFDQNRIDEIMIELDGTPNKDNLGGNSMIGVSIACAKAAAKVKGVETFEYLRTIQLASELAVNKIKPSKKFPHLYMNLINGGKHAKNDLAFQEYHVVPMVDDVKEAVNMGIAIQNSLKNIIQTELGEESIILGDEGGYAPKISDIRRPLEFLVKAIKENNFEDKIRLALDVAASSFYFDGVYKVDGKNISKDELTNIYNSLIEEFNLFSIEDPFDEEDFSDFTRLKEDNKNLFVVGDDLTVTNKFLLKKAIDEESVNAMIIKPNQIGTLTETMETMKLARENGVELIVSHRSGETEDDFIADLAFAFGCFGLKAGAPTKPERMVKYKRLIQISNLL